MPAHAPAARRAISLAQAEDMLAHIGGAELRDVWLQVGMGLKDEFGEAAFDAWDRWSQYARNYDAKACRASWRGFRARPGGVSIGTVIKLAQDGGYKFPADAGAPVSAAEQQARRAELARRRAERAERVAREDAQRQARAESAATRALADWRAAARDGECAYVARKGLDRPESVRYAADGGLLVPMLRYDLPRERALMGVQHIAADGGKRFTPGAAKAGTACRLGLAAVGEPVFVCEGWATGMSLRMAQELLPGGARRWPVFVAFDAYNLPLVCELVYQLLPTCPMVICGDDDWKTRGRDGLPHNTGRIQAQVAQEGVLDNFAAARLVVRTSPFFAHTLPRGDKDTDFNDLHRLAGLSAVAEQMQTALDCIEYLKQYG